MQFTSTLLWDLLDKLQSLVLRYWIVIRTENTGYQVLLLLYLLVYAVINLFVFFVLPQFVVLEPRTQWTLRVATIVSGLLGLYLTAKAQEALAGFTPFGGWIGRFYGIRFWNSDGARNVLQTIRENLPSGWILVQEPLQSSFAAVTSPKVNAALFEGSAIPVANASQLVRRRLGRNHWNISSSQWLAYTPEQGGTKVGVQDDLRRFVILGAQGLQSNGEKVRLAADLQLQGGDFQPTLIERTDYVSSLMTDGLSFSLINHVPLGGNVQLTDGLSHFFAPDTGLHSLAQSGSSNQVGASTLAFTNDGVLIVLLQTAANQYSGNTYVPTGSGSMDWADAEYCEDPTNLISIVKYGALRELREECGLRRRVQCFLKPYAFCRLLHRGGKPEFFFVALIDEKFDKINKWQVKRAERRFTSKYPENIARARKRAIEFGTTNLPEQIRDIHNQIKQTAKEDHLTISYQLEHGLLLLEELASSSYGSKTLNALFALRSPILTSRPSLWSRLSRVRAWRARRRSNRADFQE
jgi:hypothetical protein